MEIYKTTIKGCEVNMIFTGKNYFFHNSFYGWLAIAERQEGHYDKPQKFVLYIGNRHTLDGTMTNSVVAAAVRKFIRKCENKFVETSCEFVEEEKDLADAYVKVSYKLL